MALVPKTSRSLLYREDQVMKGLLQTDVYEEDLHKASRKRASEPHQACSPNVYTVFHPDRNNLALLSAQPGAKRIDSWSRRRMFGGREMRRILQQSSLENLNPEKAKPKAPISMTPERGGTANSLNMLPHINRVSGNRSLFTTTFSLTDCDDDPPEFYPDPVDRKQCYLSSIFRGSPFYKSWFPLWSPEAERNYGKKQFAKTTVVCPITKRYLYRLTSAEKAAEEKSKY